MSDSGSLSSSFDRLQADINQPRPAVDEHRPDFSGYMAPGLSPKQEISPGARAGDNPLHSPTEVSQPVSGQEEANPFRIPPLVSADAVAFLQQRNFNDGRKSVLFHNSDYVEVAALSTAPDNSHHVQMLAIEDGLKNLYVFDASTAKPGSVREQTLSNGDQDITITDGGMSNHLVLDMSGNVRTIDSSNGQKTYHYNFNDSHKLTSFATGAPSVQQQGEFDALGRMRSFDMTLPEIQQHSHLEAVNGIATHMLMTRPNVRVDAQIANGAVSSALVDITLPNGQRLHEKMNADGSLSAP